MNIIYIDQNYNWEDVAKKIRSGDSLVISYEHLFIGVRRYKLKKRERFTYVISHLNQEKFIEDFINFVKENSEIQIIYSTFELKQFLDLLKKIVSLYDRYKKLSVIL